MGRAPGRYSFSHALIRETLYGELSTLRRVRLHRRIGEALEDLYAAKADAHLAELAFHFFEADPIASDDEARIRHLPGHLVKRIDESKNTLP